MHFSFADILNLLSTVTLIGALVFTGLQVRQASYARRDQAAITMLQTALSENSARALELLGNIPDGAPASAINNLHEDSKRVILEFGLRLEVMGYMVFRGLVDLRTANDMVGGTVLGYLTRTRTWVEETRMRTGHAEFLEWCEWLANQLARCRSAEKYVPAYRAYDTWHKTLP
jgi:hypothetical protein